MARKKKRRVTVNGWLNRLSRVYHSPSYDNERVARLIAACPGNVVISEMSVQRHYQEYGSHGIIEGHIPMGQTITVTLSI